jgi:hypothetical protein
MDKNIIRKILQEYTFSGIEFYNSGGGPAFDSRGYRIFEESDEYEILYWKEENEYLARIYIDYLRADCASPRFSRQCKAYTIPD